MLLKKRIGKELLMNIQSKLIVSLILISLMFWLIRNLFHKRLNTSQVLFWLSLLIGAEIFTLLPPNLVDGLSVIWGNLIPVSWISFVGFVTLISYLLYQTIEVNRLQSRCTQLARNISYLELRIRETEKK